MNPPAPNVHRHSRRRLGRGQSPRPRPITVAINNSGDTALLVFSAPVQVKGLIDLAIPGRTAISQSIATPQNVSITYSGNLNSLSWSLPSPPTNTTAPTGAPIIGATGTFGGTLPVAINNILIADGAGGMIGGRGTIGGSGAVSLATGTFTITAGGDVAATSFAGDGSAITGLDFAQIGGTPPNPFDQSLNVADSPTFAVLTATTINAPIAWGQLTSIPSFNSVATAPNFDYSSAVGPVNLDIITFGVIGGRSGRFNMCGAYGGNVWFSGPYLTPTGGPDIYFFLPASQPANDQILMADNTGQTRWSSALQVLDARVAALEAALAAGVTGVLTPGAGTLSTTGGIVTSIT